MSRGRYALIGEPISGSPSPAMHNAAFRACGIDATYELRPTGVGGLAEALGLLASGRYAGLNVTTPLKTLAARAVQLDGLAARAQAVNTLWLDGLRLCGALTDIDGVRVPLRASDLPRERDAGLILGAGGASRAAALALEGLGLTVHVAARQQEQAARVIDLVMPTRRGLAVALADGGRLARLLPTLAVLVQATPVGRDGEEHALAWTLLRAGTLAFEMVYRPARTPFVAAAEAAGATVVFGWQMLLAQGAASFALWTARPAPLGAMQTALCEALTVSQDIRAR